MQERRYSYECGDRAIEYTLNFTKMTLSHVMIVIALGEAGAANRSDTVLDECKIRRHAAHRWFTSQHKDADVYCEIQKVDALGYDNPLVPALEDAWTSRVANLIMSE